MKTLVGYSSEISVAPGEAIDFMVSSEAEKPFTARIVRLIHGDCNPAGPGYREEAIPSEIDGVYPGRRQLIHAGSYAVVPAAPVLGAIASFSFQAMIWPTTPGQGEQVIASFWRDGRGFELFIDETGALSGRVGDGAGHVDSVSSGVPMQSRQWYLAALRLDAETGDLTVLQRPLKPECVIPEAGRATIATSVRTVGDAARPLLFAARAANLAADHGALHYNGKIDSPRLFAEALPDAALETLIPSDAIVANSPGLIGAWDFSHGIEGDTFADRSGHALAGQLRQLPARAMTGYNWRDSTEHWREAPGQYGAVHFHDDDIYDAGWDVSATWRVPETQRSGLYAMHVATDDDEDDLPFVIRPAAGSAARVLFLVPTASYLAYGNEHMAIDLPHAERVHDIVPVFQASDVFLMEHREYGNSLYDQHGDGSSVCYSSRLRPLLNMRAKLQSWLGGMGSALWQFNADTHITDWLEAQGIDYACITDEDLHRFGVDALAPHACVVTGTHPEYISTEIWDALEAYKARGGNLMAMGGNAFFVRIAYHRTLPGVLEVRRNGFPAGEVHHAFTGERGGLWSRIGRTPHALAGTGFIGQGFDISSYYRRRPESFDPRAAFIFEGVEEEIIGDFGLIGGGAAGLELDRADVAQGTPAHALVLASSENHTSIYMLSGTEMLINMPGQDATQCPLIHADLVFFETPAGGAVFSTGSIAWAGALSHNGYDNTVSRITGNVLRRFISGEAFGNAA